MNIPVDKPFPGMETVSQVYKNYPSIIKHQDDYMRNEMGFDNYLGYLQFCFHGEGVFRVEIEQ